MRIFIVAMPGAGNLGDDLISELLLTELLTNYPRAEIGVLQYWVENPLSFVSSDQITYLTVPRRGDPKSFRKRKRAIKQFLAQTDYILVGGGGLLQDTHFKYTVHRYLQYAFLFNGHRAIPITTGIGVGPLKRGFTKWYLRHMLKRFSEIQVRDQHSASLIRELGHTPSISTDIVEGADLSTTVFQQYPETEAALGCSIRPWKSLQFEAISKLILNICQQKNLTCRLFIFEYAQGNHTELEYGQRLKSYLETEGIPTTIYTYIKDPWETFYKAFGSVTYAIAVRFHANILWQKMGVPVLPISYAPKVKSFYEEKGGKIIPIEEISSDLDADQMFQTLEISKDYQLPNLEKLTPVSVSFSQWIIARFTQVRFILDAIYHSLKIRIRALF